MPRIVSVKVPRGVFGLVEMVSVEVDVAGFGLNEAVARFGNPDALSKTEPPKQTQATYEKGRSTRPFAYAW